MITWYSPFELTPKSIKYLELLGWSSVMSVTDIDENTIILYQTPDEIFNNLSYNSVNTNFIDFIKDGYNTINEIDSNILICDWRLEYFLNCRLDSISDISNMSSNLEIKYPVIDPNSAFFLSSILSNDPSILNLYLDFELKSILVNSLSDTDYITRLNSAMDTQYTINCWVQNTKQLTFIDECLSNISQEITSLDELNKIKLSFNNNTLSKSFNYFSTLNNLNSSLIFNYFTLYQNYFELCEKYNNIETYYKNYIFDIKSTTQEQIQMLNSTIIQNEELFKSEKHSFLNLFKSEKGELLERLQEEKEFSFISKEKIDYMQNIINKYISEKEELKILYNEQHLLYTKALALLKRILLLPEV